MQTSEYKKKTSIRLFSFQLFSRQFLSVFPADKYTNVIFAQLYIFIDKKQVKLNYNLQFLIKKREKATRKNRGKSFY